MGDPAGSELAGLLAGGTEGLVAVHDAVAHDLHAYAWFLLAPGRHAADDGPPEAVLDALLVAGETAGELVDPALTRAWLYALTRNECLRLASRRTAGWPAGAAEAAELADRHGLAPAEVAAVLGHAVRPEAEPGAPVPAAAPPEWLRAELVAALGVEAAGRRAELARRAHPYDPEGFPVPVGSRRLSARALAWSAAAAVLVALGLLVTLPAGGPTGALPGPGLAAAAPAPAGADAAPLPTLPARPFSSGPLATSAGSRPQSAPDRGADRRSATAGPADGAVSRPPTGGDQRFPRTTLLVSVRPTGDCGDTWTAGVGARVYGRDQADIAAVTASAAGRTVSLAGADGSWTGELAGLPTGRTVTLTVTATAADGSTVRSVSRQVDHDC